MDFNTPVVFKKTYRTMPCLTSSVNHIQSNILVLKDLYVEMKYYIDENPSICDRTEIVLHKGYCSHAVFVNKLDILPVVVKTVNLHSHNTVSGGSRDRSVQEALKEADKHQVGLRMHESFLDAFPRYKEKVDENGFYKDKIVELL